MQYVRQVFAAKRDCAPTFSPSPLLPFRTHYILYRRITRGGNRALQASAELSSTYRTMAMADSSVWGSHTEKGEPATEAKWEAAQLFKLVEIRAFQGFFAT